MRLQILLISGRTWNTSRAGVSMTTASMRLVISWPWLMRIKNTLISKSKNRESGTGRPCPAAQMTQHIKIFSNPGQTRGWNYRCHGRRHSRSLKQTSSPGMAWIHLRKMASIRLMVISMECRAMTSDPRRVHPWSTVVWLSLVSMMEADTQGTFRILTGARNKAEGSSTTRRPIPASIGNSSVKHQILAPMSMEIQSTGYPDSAIRIQVFPFPMIMPPKFLWSMDWPGIIPTRRTTQVPRRLSPSVVRV